VLAVLFAAGCSDPEGVRVLDERKPAPPAGPTVPADQKQFRTLAAMVPADVEKDNPHWWFFKLSGPAAVVAKYEADFDKLVGSVRSVADETNPITWELPAGWTAEMAKPGMMRYATLKAPGGEAEVAVSQAGGWVISNVQRWWGQLWGKDKEGDVTPVHLDALVRQQTVKGRLVLRVDLYGPNDPNARPMMANPHGGK
jgi:hypothetical protein